MKKISLGILLLLNLSGVANASHQDEDVFGNDLRELFPQILVRKSEPPVLKHEESGVSGSQSLRIPISQPPLSERMPPRADVNDETKEEISHIEDEQESTDFFGNSWDDLLGKKN